MKTFMIWNKEILKMKSNGMWIYSEKNPCKSHASCSEEFNSGK